MSYKTTAEKIAVMQAFLDGKKIEVGACATWGEWRFKHEPKWNWEENEYRIKEEVLPYRRYIYKSQTEDKQYVYTHHEGLPSPEICYGFVRWIDTIWQTV